MEDEHHAFSCNCDEYYGGKAQREMRMLQGGRAG